MTLPAFERWHPIGQALAAGAFMWAVSAPGAALVICTKHVRRKTIDSMEGFAAGVMLAASYWSLLASANNHGEAEFDWEPPSRQYPAAVPSALRAPAQTTHSEPYVSNDLNYVRCERFFC